MRAYHPALLALAAALALSACSRLNSENYARLHTGMSPEEVEKILGSPAQCQDVLLLKHCRWGDEQKGIRVVFAAGALLSSSAQGLD